MMNIVLHIKEKKGDIKNQEKSQNYNMIMIPTIQVHKIIMFCFLYFQEL